MLFQLKTGVGSVGSFTTTDGKTYFPGDTVDLPISYKGEAWLKPVDVESVKTVEPSKPEEPKPIILPGTDGIHEYIPAKREKSRSSTAHK